jgi:hypothetical protein
LVRAAPPQQCGYLKHLGAKKNSPRFFIEARAKPSPYEDRRRGHQGRAPRAQAIIGQSTGSLARHWIML